MASRTAAGASSGHQRRVSDEVVLGGDVLVEGGAQLGGQFRVRRTARRGDHDRERQQPGDGRDGEHPVAEETDVEYVLEFANAQLLELRYYDARLDAELPRIYDRVAEHRAGRYFRRFTQLLADLQTLVADSTETVERAENALKVTDDVYLARIYTAALEMHPLDTENRLPELKQTEGIGYCNITKCCTNVCPEDITITDNAIIPLKERVVDEYYDPLGKLLRFVRR